MASETGLRSEAGPGEGADRSDVAGRPESPPVELDRGGDRRVGPAYPSGVLVGAVVIAVAVLAWAALGLAHLGHYSLPAALGLAAVVLTAIAILVRRVAPVRVRTDPAGLVGIVLLGALAAVMFLPGFAYGVTDKDPGGDNPPPLFISRSGYVPIVQPAPHGPLPRGGLFPG